MPSTDAEDDLRRKLTHGEAMIAELRGVVAELRKQIDAHRAHILRRRMVPLPPLPSPTGGLRHFACGLAPSSHRPVCFSRRKLEQSVEGFAGTNRVHGKRFAIAVSISARNTSHLCHASQSNGLWRGRRWVRTVRRGYSWGRTRRRRGVANCRRFSVWQDGAHYTE